MLGFFVGVRIYIVRPVGLLVGAWVLVLSQLPQPVVLWNVDCS